jgi:hypothetical protein
MVSKKPPNTKGKSTHGKPTLENALILIDKITKNAEEKILLEDSIKNIIRGTDNFVGHIKKMDGEKRKELLDMYNKVIDGLKQKAHLLD